MNEKAPELSGAFSLPHRRYRWLSGVRLTRSHVLFGFDVGGAGLLSGIVE